MTVNGAPEDDDGGDDVAAPQRGLRDGGKETVELSSTASQLTTPTSACSVDDWDKLWERVSPLGLWQWLVVLIVGLGSYFGSQALFMQAFVSTQFDYFCAPPDLILMSPVMPNNVFSSALNNSDITTDNLRNENAYYSASKEQWLSYLQCFIPPVQSSASSGKALEYNKCERYANLSACSTKSNISMQETVGISAFVPRSQQLVLTNREQKLTSSRPDHFPSETCNSWIFNKSWAQYGSSIQIDFNLACEREFLLPFAQTITMLGQLIGVFFSGILSDTYGRRPSMMTTSILGMISCNLMAFAPTYWLFAMAKFITTASFSATYTIGYVLVMEVVGGSFQRTLVGQVVWIPYVVGGYFVLPLLAWRFQQWRGLVLAIGLPSILLLLNICLLPESPRWLASKGRYKEAGRGIRRAVRLNRRKPPLRNAEIDWERLGGRTPPPPSRSTANNAPFTDEGADTMRLRPISPLSSVRSIDQSHVDADDSADLKNDHSELHKRRSTEAYDSTPSAARTLTVYQHTVDDRQPPAVASNALSQIKRLLHGIRELFSRPLVRRRTLLLMFIWFVNSMVYYGLAFYSLQLPGSVYWNFAFGGVVELPAYMLNVLLSHYCGRRWPLAAVLLFCGVVSLCIATIDAVGLLQTFDKLVVVLSTMSKFFISCSYAMIWVITSEIFPTSVRNAGTGLCSMFSRFGSASAPLVGYLSRTTWPPLQLLVFGTLALAAALCTLTLPETNHQQLPQTVEEAERFVYVQRRRQRVRRPEGVSNNSPAAERSKEDE